MAKTKNKTNQSTKRQRHTKYRRRNHRTMFNHLRYKRKTHDRMVFRHSARKSEIYSGASLAREAQPRHKLEDYDSRVPRLSKGRNKASLRSICQRIDRIAMPER